MTTTTMRGPRLHVGVGTYLDGVTVFPVWTDAPGAVGLATGPSARVQVEERAGSPTVGELVLSTDGTRPVLLLEGELLEGGMQHRTLVHDLLLMNPAFRHVVPVACVEHGRWHGAAGHTRRGRHAGIGVKARLRQDESGRQQAVWEQVAGYGRAIGPSRTESLLDHLERVEREAPHLPPVLPGQRGVILGVGGRELVLELFGSRAALLAHLPALLDSARLDAALVPPARVGPVPGYRARTMAAHLAAVPFEHRRPQAGDGVAVEARTTHAAARGLCLPSGPLAHLAVLNTRHPLLEDARA